MFAELKATNTFSSNCGLYCIANRQKTVQRLLFAVRSNSIVFNFWFRSGSINILWKYFWSQTKNQFRNGNFWFHRYSFVSTSHFIDYYYYWLCLLFNRQYCGLCYPFSMGKTIFIFKSTHSQHKIKMLKLINQIISKVNKLRHEQYNWLCFKF